MLEAPLPPRPSVGIVISVGRDGHLLGGALRSVRKQRYKQWRCVVVDDASVHDIGAAVGPFRRTDGRIELLRHAAAGGVSAARNTGLRHLDTDLVIFLDAADRLASNALFEVVSVLERWRHEAAVAGVLTDVSEQVQGQYRRRSTGSSPVAVVDWINYNDRVPFGIREVALRRDLVARSGGFDESLAGGAADWELRFRLLRHGYRFEPSRSHSVDDLRHRESVSSRGHTWPQTGVKLVEAAEQWAQLDDSLTVGRGAAAPLSRARAVLADAERAAAEIGSRVTTAGSLDPLLTSEVFSALDLVAVPEGRRHDLVRAAISGACRVLGVSPQDTGQLSVAAQNKLERIGRAVAAEMLDRPYEPAHDPAGYDATSRHLPPDVLLAAESVADVQALLPIAGRSDPNVRVAAVDLEVVNGCSGANDAWRAAGVGLARYHDVMGAITAVGTLFACAPVGPVVADLLSAARRAQVHCQVVEVPGRPAALPCSGADRVAPSDDLDAWNVTTFSALLPVEDGPLDVNSVERLEALHNQHRGEVAVVIGNGPSLNDTELEILTGVPTFGVNAIFLAKDRLPGADHVLRRRGHDRCSRRT